MMNNQKFINFLGIAKRAGKITSGEGKLLKEIRQNKIYFLIMSKDAGLSTSKTFHDKAKFYKIPFNDQFTKTDLSNAIGIKRTMIGVNDSKIAKNLIMLNKKIKGQ